MPISTVKFNLIIESTGESIRPKSNSLVDHITTLEDFLSIFNADKYEINGFKYKLQTNSKEFIVVED